MRKKLVSIIIPLYNSERYISECVESCLKQTYNPLEIIVVDDGSTDHGLNVVKKIAEANNNVIVVHTKNNGVSSARNTGIKRSNGEYICFIDADDSIEGGFIETMVGHLESNNADFCFSMNTRGEEIKSEKIMGRIITPGEAEAFLLSQKVKVGCWNKMYRKSSLGDIRFRNDLFYGEGLYFINQVAHCSKKIVVCEDALYNYRKVNPESATTKFNIKKMINGEKSLLDIKELVKVDGCKVNRMWSQHYCLFCINAMKGLIRNNSKDETYKEWHKKMQYHVLSALLSKGGLKMKARIFLAFVSPKLLLGVKK